MQTSEAADWSQLIPAVAGSLPLGGPLVRTDPGGPANAPVAILGVYPAATRLARATLGDRTLLLPAEVERTSFEPSSRSGAHLRKHYLEPLGVDPFAVRTFDLMPYFLANTAVKEERSMWSNIAAYTKAHGTECLVRPRPAPDDLLREARVMPGNEARLSSYLRAPSLRLLLTLGNEAAAWVRGLERAADAQPLLYTEAVTLEVCGRSLLVAHLTHPGNLMRNQSWHERHATWCADRGKQLMKTVLGALP